MSEAAAANTAPESAQEAAVVETPAPTTSLAVFDPFRETLAALKQRHHNVVFDLASTKGDKAARQARLELTKVRTGSNEARLAWARPINEQLKAAKELTDQIGKEADELAKPIDEQIKVDEARRLKLKEEQAEAERQRVATIRGRINVLMGLPVQLMSMTADEIGAVISDVKAAPINAERFAEFLPEAQALVERMVPQLEQMEAGARAREDEAKRLGEARAAQERQQRELDERNAELEREAQRQRNIQAIADRAAAEQALRDADDAARSSKAQTDAFPAERDEQLTQIAAANAPAEPPAAVAPAGTDDREQPQALVPVTRPTPAGRISFPPVEATVARAAAPEPAAPSAAGQQQADEADSADEFQAGWASGEDDTQGEQPPEGDPRPTDLQILADLAEHYQVDRATALAWLTTIDLPALAEAVDDGVLA